MIESLNNEKIKKIAKLKERKYQDIEGKFLVEGAHLVEEAHKAGLLDSVLVLNGEVVSYDDVTVVSDSVMKKISSLTNVPKIVGVSRKPMPKGVGEYILMLDRVQDPGNLGTIIRSAVSFGVDTIVLGEGSVSAYNPKVVRASEGMLFHINIIEADLKEFIRELKENGYKIFTTRLKDANELSKCEINDKMAVIVGNEGSGVSDELSSLADDAFYIDMNALCESLNVGVATSIVLYELKKKRDI